MEARGRPGRARRAGTWMAIAAVALLCAPATGAARPGDEVRPRSLHLSVFAEGTRGYSVRIDTLGHRRVILTAEKGGQVATYRVRGSVSRRHVKADFGRFGRVSLRFRGSPRPFGFARKARRGSKRKVPRRDRRCVGRPSRREVGRFKGVLEFEGQRGFTRVATGEATGEVRRFYRRVCKKKRLARRQGRGARSEPFALRLFIARDRERRALTRFEALGFESSPAIPLPPGILPALVSAERKERVGRVRVSRSTFLITEPGAVVISRHGVKPARVRIAPPSPFAGVGSYKGPTKRLPGLWTGSLRVRLAGAGALPLTGPDFETLLCRVAGDRPSDPCLRRAEASSLALLRAAAPTPSPSPRPGSPR
jgi:hypothetical protein